MFTGLESPTHLIIVLVVVLLIFGPKRIPELARNLGSGLREFKQGAESDGHDDALDASEEREQGSDPR